MKAWGEGQAKRMTKMIILQYHVQIGTNWGFQGWPEGGKNIWGRHRVWESNLCCSAKRVFWRLAKLWQSGRFKLPEVLDAVFHVQHTNPNTTTFTVSAPGPQFHFHCKKSKSFLAFIQFTFTQNRLSWNMWIWSSGLHSIFDLEADLVKKDIPYQEE